MKSSSIVIGFLFCALFLLSSRVHAQYSGEDLFRACSDPVASDNELTECFYYVRGWFDATNFSALMSELAGVDEPILKYSDCYSADISIPQAARVLSKFLAEHPEVHHRPASLLVPQAFDEAFCD